MFTLRNQLSMLATGIAAVVIAAIPVTVSFAQVNYNYNYNNNANVLGNYIMPQNTYSTSNQYNYSQMQPAYPHQYLYWCTGQGGGYYSYSPCPPQRPSYPQHANAPTYQYQTYSYNYPQYYSYYYPQTYYQPTYYDYYDSYGYEYGYAYDYDAYAYDYGYSDWWY